MCHAARVAQDIATGISGGADNEGVVRFNSPPRHKLIRYCDAERLTGRSPDQLRKDRDVQTLLRVSTDGTREEVLRVPAALLLDGQDDTAADEHRQEPDRPAT